MKLAPVRVLLVTLLLAGFACQQNARHQEYRAVKATFEQACKTKDAEQCAYLAWLHHSVRLYMRKSSPEKAGPMFREACKMGSANACLGAKLVTKARGLWKAACIKGSITACNELIATTVAMSERNAAISVLEKSCADKKSDGRACGMLADTLHKQDKPRWSKLARSACARNYHPACARLGSRLYRGDKIASNKPGALKLWQASCDQKHPASCVLLSIHYIIEKKRGKANALVKTASATWKRHCRDARRDACDQHLRWLARPKDRKRCLGGDPAACRGIMSRLHGFSNQRERLNFPHGGH